MVAFAVTAPLVASNSEAWIAAASAAEIVPACTAAARDSEVIVPEFIKPAIASLGPMVDIKVCKYGTPTTIAAMAASGPTMLDTRSDVARPACTLAFLFDVSVNAEFATE